MSDRSEAMKALWDAAGQGTYITSYCIDAQMACSGASDPMTLEEMQESFKIIKDYADSWSFPMRTPTDAAIYCICLHTLEVLHREMDAISLRLT